MKKETAILLIILNLNFLLALWITSKSLPAYYVTRMNAMDRRIDARIRNERRIVRAIGLKQVLEGTQSTQEDRKKFEEFYEKEKKQFEGCWFND